MTIFHYDLNWRCLRPWAAALILFLGISAQGCKKGAITTGPPNQQDTTPVVSSNPDTTGYVLTWSDEFNYNGPPDPSKWEYDIGNGSNGWGNQELEYYTSSPTNAWVANGYLTIEAKKENIAGFKYSSARLVSRTKAQWKYGKLVVRARIPSGKGTWPAIWMLGAEQPLSWPADGEIDIMEEVGFQANIIHGSIHTTTTESGSPATSSIPVPTAQDSFHLYSIVWTPQLINIYTDSTKLLTYFNQGQGLTQWPFDSACYLLLNIAVGGSWGGQQGVDTSAFPTDMVIDYVRVYQKPD
ncbi:MAG TPA: glycoside hydrolase family 16 protein [Chitinophagaceae bacterium]|nr:glycoside hydrolase family 16 protein [Chitinophagaceae bacterium]